MRRRPSTSSSSTPAPTRAPAPRARPRCRWASCSTPVAADRWPDAPDARRRPPPAAAVRRPQLHRRRARRPGRSASTASSSPGAGPPPGARRRPPPFLPAPAAPGRRPTTVALDDLVAFLEHPVKGFLRAAASGCRSREADDDAADALPVALGRPRSLGGRRPAAAATGSRACDLDRCRAGGVAARRRCRPARWAIALLAERRWTTSSRWSRRRPSPGARRRPPSRRRRRRAARRRPASSARSAACTATPPLRVEYSRLAAEAAAAGLGAAAWRSPRATGRAVAGGDGRARASGSASPGRPSVRAARMPARAVLAELVALRGDGLCAPLPLPTSHRARLRPHAAPGRRRPADALAEARAGVGERRGGERDDAAHERVSGAAAARARRCSTARPGRRAASRPGSATLALRAVGTAAARRRTLDAPMTDRLDARRVRRLRRRCPPAPPCSRPARHRQDVHDRRARRPLRRRGRRRRCPS